MAGAEIAELTRSIFQGAIQIYDGTDEHGFRKFDSKWQELFGNMKLLRLSVSLSHIQLIERLDGW